MALLLLLCGLQGCAAGSYLWYRAFPDYPEGEDETRQIPGLGGEVSVWWDPDGVPHIEAESELDLLRAIGFVHARERFFAMDMLRRVARGRLSELIGEQPVLGRTSVQLDMQMRAWGLDASARAEAEAMTDERRAAADAYIAGVNAGRAAYEPLEYRLLRVEPEPWTLADSLAVGFLNAWSVCHNWQQETVRLILALEGGVERAEAIYPTSAWVGGYSLPASAGAERTLPEAVAPELRAVFTERPWRKAPSPSAAYTPPGPVIGGASNGWVIGGSRSKSGKPMVANDPHLTHLVPSLLFQQHIKAPGVDAIGATFPGLPWILTGHNGRIAWGTTSAVGDLMDLYVERADPEDPARILIGGTSVPVESISETIRIKDGAAREFTYRRTPHGPLLNDIVGDVLPPDAPLVSIAWSLDGAGGGVEALRRVNMAQDVEAFRAAIGLMTLPAQNWMVADQAGTIALLSSGRPPKRRHLGTFPAPGWDPSYAWEGYHPADGAPGLVVPPGGDVDIFANGNNLLLPPERQAFTFAVDAAPNYRHDRIVERLKAVEKHDLESMAAVQLDQKLLRAERVRPAMLAALRPLKLEGQAAEARNRLSNWDLVADRDSVGATIFFSLYRELMVRALDDELPERGRDFFLTMRYGINAADLWYDDPEHIVWDDRRTAERETLETQVAAAFPAAVTDLSERLGADLAKWGWGRLHDAPMKHPFGGRKTLSKTFNLPPVEAGGAFDSVWKSHMNLGHPEHPFRAMAGPVIRTVMDLADLGASRWVLDTGVSGWPSSPHYGDQHVRWAAGETLPMRYDWDVIRGSATGRLVLAP